MRALVEQYLLPLYAYVRRKTGWPDDEAREAVHDFYLTKLPGLLSRARQEKGRFRGLLKLAVDGWLVDRHRSATAQKRGAHLLCALPDDAGEYYEELACDELTPDKLWDKACAYRILHGALDDLEHLVSAEGDGLIWQEMLAEAGMGGSAGPGRAAAAEQLGISSNYFSVKKRRLREQLKQAIVERIDELCFSAREMQAERVCILAVLGLNAEAS